MLTVCALLATSARELAAQQSAPAGPIRLRVAWGGGDATRWHGALRVDKGTISRLERQSGEPGAAAAVWLKDGQLLIDAISPRKRDVVEIVADSSAEAKLLIQLTGTEGQPAKAEIRLADLLQRPYRTRLDERGNTIDVQVVPRETLEITTRRDPLIFAPGEQFSFDLTPTVAGLEPGTTLDIQASLTPAAGENVVWSESQRLAVPVTGAPKVTLNVPLPQAEGVYSVGVTAVRPSGFQSRFFPAKPAPLAERRFQLVVLAPQKSADDAEAQWQSVLEIDPTSARWWERLPSWTQFSRIPGLNRGPLGSIRAGAVDRPSGRYVELPPTLPGAEPHWQAYTLPLQAVGAPHMLEIEYPADAEQSFCMSIVEPNAAGVVERVGRNAGVYVSGLGRDDGARKRVQHMVFWPRTQAPLLLVANQHPTAAAHFGHIRVLKCNSNELESVSPPPSKPNRLVAAYFARPLVSESFGTQTPVPNGDNWQSCFESAARLSQYVRFSGFNGAVVATPIDALPGGANMRQAATGQAAAATAPIGRADLLELQLRVFDRGQLALLPAIAFETPIAELEELRRSSDPKTSGLEWIGRDGRTWLEVNGTADGRAPYYNLLDTRVQQSMLGVVRALVERYGNHPAFAGVAVQLSSHGFVQLPPLDWGFDDATVGRFEQQTGIQLSTNSGPDRFAERHALATGKHADVWRSWRAAQLSEFYRKLATIVCRADARRKLILTTEDAFAASQVASRIRPDLLADNRIVATLSDLGIDREALMQVPGLVLSPTRFVEPPFPLQDRAAHLEFNDATTAWHAEHSEVSATTLFHPPENLRLPSFEAQSQLVFAPGDGFIGQPLAFDSQLCRPYAAACIDNDPAIILDGGHAIPLGQEESLRRVRTILQQLPTAAKVTETAGQPVVVRAYEEAGQTTVAAVNMSPWPVETQVALDVGEATQLWPLAPSPATSNSPSQAIPLAAGRQSWSPSLAPYEIQAVRIASPGVKVAHVQAELNQIAGNELSAAVSDLSNRELTQPRHYQALFNPGFEPIGRAGPVPGWQLTQGAGTATAALDATSPHSGKTCLYFRSAGQLAIVESEPFPAPPTGQLAVQVFVRGQLQDSRSQLRLVVESTNTGEVYRRAANVAGANIQANDWGRGVIIFVNDLPLDSRSELRIKFELTGPGELLIDDLQLFDLLFPIKVYPQAQAEIRQLLILIHAAKKAQEEQRVRDCLKLLEGYWPQFLFAYAPPLAPVIAAESAEKLNSGSATPPNENEQQPYPGIGDRLKRMVPGPLRR
jgi:hypothetical protein